MKKIILTGLITVAAAAAVILLLLPVQSVRIVGNEYYSEEELKEMIFGEQKPRYFIVRLKEIFGRHPQIPFVESYELTFGAERSISVRIYERSLAGYLLFQNYYLYFDWSGTLVESSNVKLDGIYEVDGLGLGHAVIGEKLPLTDESQLRTVLTITQFLNSEEILWQGKRTKIGDLTQKIRFQSDGVSVEVSGISVLLGDAYNTEEKLFLMSDMLPELAGRKGILYLDTYKEGAAHPSYVFKEKQ